MRVIYIARRYLAHTWVGRTTLAGRLKNMVFWAAAPDLNEPVEFRGTSFYVDPADRSIVPSVVGGYYEKYELDIFEDLVSDSSVFFDVGANVGLYSVLACRRSPELRAYAFEPVVENQDLLKRNIALHHLESRVVVQPVAVSDRSGTARIHLAHSGTHSIDNERGSGSTEVATVPLDVVAEELDTVPDIMKVDVEGHEGAVIDGAQRILADNPPTLFIEYAPEGHRDVEGFLGRLGAVFTHCFMIDDVTGSVAEIRLADLNRKRMCNLVLTNNDRHAARVRRFAGG